MSKVLKNKLTADKVAAAIPVKKNLIAKTHLVKLNLFRADPTQKGTLLKAGRLGTSKAIRVSKALGLSIIYLKNGTLYRELPDGSTETIEVKTEKQSPLKLKKGLILHAKR